MITSRHIDKICIVIFPIMLCITLLFMNAKELGITSGNRSNGYESRLFDHSYVHTIDIVMDDWDELIENATGEEYYNCAVVIDGEAFKNVAIRGKGNTSLSSVEQMDSERYSFKLEFDQYQNGNTYYGLDKLCLNNIIQDNTYMKDYLAYVLMDDFGVTTPLCSFVYITVNGEDWGLYLAVEGVETSFLQRNYNGAGDLYKPDSQMNGGGRGNGRDFDMDSFMEEIGLTDEDGDGKPDQMPEDFGDFNGGPGGEQPEFGGGFPEGSDNTAENSDNNRPSGRPDGNTDMPDGERPEFGGGSGGDFSGGFPGGGPGGMGSSDVKLQYIDDDPDSYSNIFNNAKTDISIKDQTRLISSLKDLSEYENLEEILNMEEVLRYFVVHTFLVNGDSYTGAMVHNYYLHEQNGQLEMIPWDYNLAYGTFMAGDASGSVNDPIDSPVDNGNADDRPMRGWIFSDESYTEMYHSYYNEFVSEFITSGKLFSLIDETAEMITPYVEKDPTSFCTYEDFLTGVEAMRTFCELRGESVMGQLDGSIPSTEEGQSADSESLIDTGDLNLQDLGSMGGGSGGPGGPPGDFGGSGNFGGPPGDFDGSFETSEDFERPDRPE